MHSGAIKILEALNVRNPCADFKRKEDSSHLGRSFRN